jgi:hypothetical protein
MHTGATTRARQSSTNKGTAERIVRTKTRWVQVVVSNVVRRPTGHLKTTSWWPVHLVFVLKAWRRKVAYGVGSRTSHFGKWICWRRRHVWVRHRITTERSVWVLCFLGTALGACVILCLGSLYVSFALEFGNEFLNDVDLEIMENVYQTESANAPNWDPRKQHTSNSLLRCEYTAELFKKITSVFLVIFHSDSNREFLGVHNFTDRSFETANVIVSHSQSPHLNLLAHAVHANAEGHG